ncbi:MAG: potassium channel family protein, partial [Bdellovibrionales bacterium]|nr:potassium channel family protein [Bdellovibrionales bacterium]
MNQFPKSPLEQNQKHSPLRSRIVQRLLHIFQGSAPSATSLHAPSADDYYGELARLALIVLNLTILGSIGYMVIEGWSFFDSLYMTVITLSTVGYSETHELSTSGRLFTIVLILVGVALAGVILTKIFNHLFDQQFNIIRRRKRMLDRIGKLDNHVVFCGFGRLAQVAIRELHEHGLPLVVIDQNEMKVQEAEEMGVYAILGDATQDEVLRQAGISKAQQIVSLLPKDADNLYVILAAREINRNIYSITRAEYSTGEKRLLRAGADKVVSPYTVSGHRIADGLLRPHVMNFLDLASSGSNSDLVIEEIRIPAGSPLHGVALRDS